MNTISIKLNVEAVGRCNTTHNVSEFIQMNLFTGGCITLFWFQKVMSDWKAKNSKSKCSREATIVAASR
jgi:hypothetical protein